MARRCSTCDSGYIKLVDDELRAGGNVTQIASRYQLSESSVRRHQRNHLTTGVWAVPEVDSTLLVHRVLTALDAAENVLRDAMARGERSVALRAAQTIVATAASLADQYGIDDLSIEESMSDYSKLVRAVGRAAQARPGFASELADAARAQGYTPLAEEADSLAADAVAFNEKKAAA